MGADAARTIGADPALVHTAGQFLFHEAMLLDRGRFDEWLALFDEDGTYWVPLERDQADPFGTSSLIYDDRRLLEVRVRQFRHPRAHARTPTARTVHQVSNVQVTDATPELLVVASTLVLVEFRAERQRVFGALVEHRLRRTPAGLRIVAKRVDLANSEGELDGIAFLI